LTQVERVRLKWCFRNFRWNYSVTTFSQIHVWSWLHHHLFCRRNQIKPNLPNCPSQRKICQTSRMDQKLSTAFVSIRNHLRSGKYKTIEKKHIFVQTFDPI